MPPVQTSNLAKTQDNKPKPQQMRLQMMEQRREQTRSKFEEARLKSKIISQNKQLESESLLVNMKKKKL